MKKTGIRYISIGLLSIIPYFVIAQPSFNSFPIKEHYDDLYYGLLDLNAHQIDPITVNNHGNYGETISGELESYLRMYEFTRDKAYLYKFIDRTITVQNNRGGIGAFGGFGWSTYFYKNGLMLWPQAHFVHLVKVDEPGLAGTPLFDDLLTANTTTFTTIGQFANWLGARVEETMDYFIDNDYWISPSLGFASAPGDKTPRAINKQSAFAAALFYMGEANNIQDYQLKAIIMAALYKSNIDIEDGCTGFPCNPLQYHHPLLRTMNNNSYWWYHAGWSISIRDCPGLCYLLGPKQPDLNKYIEFSEDISHATQVLIFPEVAHRYGLSYNNTTFFTDADMTRFRNTFAKNVYDNGNFHNAVNGADGPIYSNNNCAPNNCPINFHRKVVPTWAFLYQFDDFDNSPKPLYEIIMEYYDTDLEGVSANNKFVGAKYKGLADMMRAQWDNECMSLTLKNREVVYDQDFFAEDELTVDPALDNLISTYYPDESFADPIIITDEFTVEQGVEANFRAGKRIVVKKGHIKAGARSRGYIDPSLACNGNGKTDGSSGNETNPVVYNQPTPQTKEKEDIITQQSEAGIEIYPNPTAGEFTLTVQGSEFNVQSFIYIYDIFGRLIYKSEIVNQKSKIVNISRHPKGIYLVKVFSGEKVYIQKLVHQ